MYLGHSTHLNNKTLYFTSIYFYMALKPDDEIKTTQVTTFWSQKNDLSAGAALENIVWKGGA